MTPIVPPKVAQPRKEATPQPAPKKSSPAEKEVTPQPSAKKSSPPIVSAAKKNVTTIQPPTKGKSALTLSATLGRETLESPISVVY
jgi:hypothetical protein